jgi:hypothetical protein
MRRDDSYCLIAKYLSILWQLRAECEEFNVTFAFIGTGRRYDKCEPEIDLRLVTNPSRGFCGQGARILVS